MAYLAVAYVRVELAYTKGPLRHQRTDRKCDFFILVALRESEIPSFFVVPKAIVGTKRCITVTKAGKYLQYLNAWDAVIEKELHQS